MATPAAPEAPAAPVRDPDPPRRSFRQRAGLGFGALVGRLRRRPRLGTCLGLIFAFGIAGLATELLLLAHYEDLRQRIPLALLVLGSVAAAGAWPALAKSRDTADSSSPKSTGRLGSTAIGALRAICAAMVLAGGLGMYFHLSGNREFVLEVYPSATGSDVLWRSLRGAFPALAPGALMQLGLVGGLWTMSRQNASTTASRPMSQSAATSTPKTAAKPAPSDRERPTKGNAP